MSDKEIQEYVDKFLKNQKRYIVSLENLIKNIGPKSTCMVCDLYTYKKVLEDVRNIKCDVFENLITLARHIYSLDTEVIDRLPRKLTNFLEPLT